MIGIRAKAALIKISATSCIKTTCVYRSDIHSCISHYGISSTQEYNAEKISHPYLDHKLLYLDILSLR